ncbi:urease accessory protein UreF [Variovorax paradoxus]|nr:urease accessory protein UreF [Variovorax paradoxus]
MAGQRGKPLGQLDGRRVRAAREHHVRERVELVLERGVDGRVRMAEEIDPP